MNKQCYYSCSVFGCLNTTKNCNYTFFNFPKDIQRRSLWLSLIDREDANNKCSTYHRVCEAHFEKSSLMKTSNRTLLRKGSDPKLMLPLKKNQNKESQATVETKESFTQHEKLHRDSNTQTAAHLSANTPQKRKLEKEMIELKKRLKTMTAAGTSIDIFYKLCDKFLTENLSKVVKEQAKLKFHSSGNRYSTEYKIFCTNLFNTSPKAYNMLSERLLNMPSKTSLKRIRKVIQDKL